jgi:hypothetical protein
MILPNVSLFARPKFDTSPLAVGRASCSGRSFPQPHRRQESFGSLTNGAATGGVSTLCILFRPSMDDTLRIRFKSTIFLRECQHLRHCHRGSSFQRVIDASVCSVAARVRIFSMFSCIRSATTTCRLGFYSIRVPAQAVLTLEWTA